MGRDEAGWAGPLKGISAYVRRDTRASGSFSTSAHTAGRSPPAGTHLPSVGRQHSVVCSFLLAQSTEEEPAVHGCLEQASVCINELEFSNPS